LAITVAATAAVRVLLIASFLYRLQVWLMLSSGNRSHCSVAGMLGGVNLHFQIDNSMR